MNDRIINLENKVSTLKNKINDFNNIENSLA
jgi:hypothetical protein